MLSKNNLSHRFKLNNSKKDKEIKTLKFENLPKPIAKPQGNEVEITEVAPSDIQEELKNALLEKIETTPVWFEYTKNRQKELIRNFLDKKIAAENIQISDIDKEIITDNLISSVSDFGAIQYLLDNEKVSKVIINGTTSVLIEIDNNIFNTETSLTEKQLSYILNSIATMGIEKYEGIKSCQTDKYSITVVAPNLCKNGYNICIKKIKESDKDTLIKNKILTKELFNLILSFVQDGKNIIISGPVNSCKTSLLEAILKETSSSKRSVLLGNNQEMPYCKDIIEYQTDIHSNDFKKLLLYIQKNNTDFIFSDFNEFNTAIVAQKASLQTVWANSTESLLRQIISAYINSGYDEKFAKHQALSDIDIIISTDFINKSPKVITITELTPAKTLSSSLKKVVEFIDGKYEINYQKKKLKTPQTSKK